MRTTCVLRRSWSHLQEIGSSCAPLRSPRIFSNLGERFCSTLSDCTPSPCPEGCGQHVSPRPPPASTKFKDGYWSAYHLLAREGGGQRYLPSEFHKAIHIYGFTAFDEEHKNGFKKPPVARMGYDSKIWSEFGANRGEQLQFELEINREKLNEDLARYGNDDASPQLMEKERNLTVNWDNFRGARQITFPGGLCDVSRHVIRIGRLGNVTLPSHCRTYSSLGASPAKSDKQSDQDKVPEKVLDYSQRAVVTALWCNFLVFCLKIGVWVATSSHVILAEAIHSLADLANQGLIAYGLVSSRRAPDAMHPYGYTKERFVWSLISAVGIFCLGSGATIIHGVQNLWTAQPLENSYLAALVIGGSVIMEGASLLVAISCVRNGAKAEGMTLPDYIWRGHDPTAVAVMMEDGAAVTGLAIAGAALTAAHYTGNPVWDPIGSIVVGHLLGAVAIFLIQRNRHALLGRSMDDNDVRRVLDVLSKDPVVDAIYDCKSEVIGPGAYRFKAEIDFNGVTIVQNYIQRAGRGNWHKEFQEAVSSPEPGHLDRVMAAYGEEVVSALGSEVDRLEREIQKVVPGIRHVDIEAHNPHGPAPRERLYLPFRQQDNIIST